MTRVVPVLLLVSLSSLSVVERLRAALKSREGEAQVLREQATAAEAAKGAFARTRLCHLLGWTLCVTPLCCACYPLHPCSVPHGSACRAHKGSAAVVRSIRARALALCLLTAS